MKDRDPARVDNPFLIEELSEERPGILLWTLEGLHRLLANRYQFTISERSRRNLEAAMEDGDNLSQFMQAQAYVRFRPDSEERSTYLYRAYTKWCEDNLESPVPQKKFSQFLLKNAGKYGLTFSKHIEGKFAFVKRSETMKSPVGTLSNGTVLRQQDGGTKSRQVPIWQKSNLTLEEAAAYSGIGINKLRSMTDSDECKFVLWNGTKRLIKRRKLDEYLDKAFSI